MPLLSLEQYSERQHRSLQRIKEMMTALAQRAETQYQRHRRHQRKDFQGVVSVRLPAAIKPDPVNGPPDAFEAWAYDISQGGIALISPDIIPQASVVIGLKLPDGSLRWMPGRIVRSRQIPEEGFIDYGIAFQRPAT